MTQKTVPASCCLSTVALEAPHGSRLSCGASAGGRKRPALRYLPVGAQTYPSFESRPRQLQALVRLRRNLGFRLCLCFIGARMALLPPALGLGTSRYCASVRSEPWSDQ